jgi:outer membrane protein OmpA-like peptidoglycan-associated protein
MLRLFQIVCFFCVANIFAQEEIQSIYFEFDKYNLDEKQAISVIYFIKKNDSTRIESIQIYGYCDDRGKEVHNLKLSQNRAATIQNKLIANGIKNKIIVTIEGKGRVMIDDDVLENLPEVRSKNRRVDVVLNLKPLPKIEIPGVYKTIEVKHIVGDRIYLENILYDRGSSKLNLTSKNELDKIAKLLQKYKKIEIEIQGHVCCTPPFQKEAIDRETKKRQLSTNRAETVYKYLILRKIDKNRMIFKGYGNTKSLGKEPQYDRRVELLITKI